MCFLIFGIELLWILDLRLVFWHFFIEILKIHYSREQTWKILFYLYSTWASNTNGSNRIIGFSFVKPGTSAGNSDHLLTIVNDITIIPIRKTSIKFNIVEISHGKKTFVSTRKAKGTFFNLPIFSSGSGYSIGKL